jgi:hypothetical protein
MDAIATTTQARYGSCKFGPLRELVFALFCIALGAPTGSDLGALCRARIDRTCARLGPLGRVMHGRCFRHFAVRRIVEHFAGRRARPGADRGGDAGRAGCAAISGTHVPENTSGEGSIMSAGIMATVVTPP